ncbi:MAG: hypothetical protein ACP5K8_09285 [Nitrososphaeria archaeon]
MRLLYKSGRMKRQIDPRQIIIDRRSGSVDLSGQEKFLKEYVGRKLDVTAYERSWKVVKEVVDYCQDKVSEEDRITHKILVDDDWIWYKDLRNPDKRCPGDEKAISYIKMHDRLHPECEKCRKVLLFNFDEKFLRKITEEFLTKPFTFDFKIARDLGVLVSYARGDKEKDGIIAYLNKFLKTYGLSGRIQWRIGGRYLQKAAPHLFKSAKMLNYEV